jgi:hypothetical protein
MNRHAFREKNNREIGVALTSSEKADFNTIDECIKESESIRKMRTTCAG